MFVWVFQEFPYIVIKRNKVIVNFNLHSSMDRLKGSKIILSTTLKVIYIPVWID